MKDKLGDKQRLIHILESIQEIENILREKILKISCKIP